MAFLQKRKILAAIIIVILIAGGAAAYLKFKPQTSADSSSPVAPPIPTIPGFKVEPRNLPSLAAGHYDAWEISGTTKTNIGKFNVAQDGNLTSTDGKPLAGNALPFQGNLVEGDSIAVTVESADSKDDQPSPSVILHGLLKSDGSAVLAFDAVDLSAATAKYSLATPTDDPAKNEASGLWFGLPGTKPAPLLSLQPAPAGWKYEGWILIAGKPVSTGRFSDPKSKDDFNGFSATKKPAPNFPGQDFLVNAPADLGIPFPLNLADGSAKVMLTLEPDKAGTDPTGITQFLPLFTADIPSGLKDHLPTDLTKSASLPQATFTYSQ